MENKSSMSRAERLRREKVTRYSIRKYSFGAASVAVAALFMFLGNGAVSVQAAEVQGTQVTGKTDTQLEQDESKPATEVAPALNKTQLESYISEIETKLANGSYANKTDESVAVLKADLEAAKVALVNATTQDQITKAYNKLVNTANAGLRNKPVEKKETPAVDTTNGKETVGKKAANTEKKSDTNSIENTGSNDTRNGKALDKNNAFRAETTETQGNFTYSMEYSTGKEIYLYNEEDADVNITVSSTAGNITKATVKAGSGQFLLKSKSDQAIAYAKGKGGSMPPEEEVEIDGYGWSYHQTLTETQGPVTIKITGKPNDTFKGLTSYTKTEDQRAVLGARYLQLADSTGAKLSGGSKPSAPGYFNLVVKSQTYKYDIKLPESNADKIAVSNVDSLTEADIAKIKNEIKIQYSDTATTEDARLASKKGEVLANKSSVVAENGITVENGTVTVTYKDGSVDTTPVASVARTNEKPTVEIPFSLDGKKDVFVYANEDFEIPIKFKDDTGKVASATVKRGGNQDSPVKDASNPDVLDNQYNTTVEKISTETVATAENPAIVKIKGNISKDNSGIAASAFPKEPNQELTIVTRYATATDTDGAFIDNTAKGNTYATDPGAFTIKLKAQTAKYDIKSLEGADKVAVSDANNVTDTEFAKIKEKVKIAYASEEKNPDKNIPTAIRGTDVENQSDRIASITKDGNNVVVTYKDGSIDKKPLTDFARTNLAPTVELPYSNADKRQIYVYTGENTDLTFTGKDDITVKNLYLRNKGLDESDNASGYGFTIGKVTDSAVASGEGTVSDDKKTATIKMVGVTNLKAGQKWTSFIEAKDNDGVKSMPANESYSVENYELRRRKPGYVEFIVKSQTDKYDIKTPTEKVVVTDPANVTEADLAKVKEKLQLEYKQDNDDANIAKDTAVDKNGKIQSVTKDDRGNLVVTYTDGSKDTRPLSEFVTLDKQPAIDEVNKAAEKQIEAINNNPEATQEEKDEAIKKVNADKAKTLDEIAKPEVTTKDALDKAQNAGTDAIAADNPVVAKKDAAKADVEAARKAKEDAIKADTNLTQAEQAAAIAKNNTAAAEATKAIDAATTNDAVDQAKTAGTTAIAKVNPVAKENAKEAIANALTDKNSEIDKRTDLTDAEKTAAKAEAQKLADAELAKINAQPDNAETADAAAAAQKIVNDAEDKGVADVTSVNPVAKEAAKKAVAAELAKKEEQIDARTDLTKEEKDAAKKEAQDKAKEATDAIDAQPSITDSADKATAAQTAVDGAKDKGVADIKAVDPVAAKKPAAKKAVEDALKDKVAAIDARADLTPEEKQTAKEKAAEEAKKATDAIDAATTDAAVDTAKTAGTGEIAKVNPVAKTKAKDEIAKELAEKEKAIDARTDLTDKEKAAAKEDAKAKAKEATNAINAQPDNAETPEKAAEAQTAVDGAKDKGVADVKAVNPVAKEAAKKAIVDELAEKEKAIDGRTDLTDEEKAAAKKDAQDKAKEATDAIDAQPSNAETPEKAAEAQTAVDGAKDKGVADVKAVDPVAAKKPAAKKAIDDALTAKNNEIDARTDLTPEEKTKAKEIAKAKAEAAKDAVDKATTNAEVDKVKTDGTTAVANVTPVAKEAAKTAIADALTAKNKEIDARTDLTDEEKTAAKKEAKDKADAQLAEIAKQPDAADTPEAAKTAQDAVDAAKKTGVADVTAVNPAAVKKTEAKQAIDDALTAKNNAIDARTDLTDAEKKAAKDKAAEEAKKAKEAIDAATTDAAVDTAKTAGLDEVAKVNPVAKEAAKKAVADELAKKEAEIDARTDLTDAEKAAAKKDAQAKAKSATDVINAQPDNAETPEAATAAQTAVDNAKDKGVADVKSVNPVAKEAAKKAVADELAKKEAEIDARTDLTKEEKDAAKKDAQDKAKSATDAINAQPDNAETPEKAAEAQKAVDTAKKTGVDEVAAVNPEAVTKPVAKKAIDDKLAEQLKAIENTPDATDEEKKVAADAAKALAEEAKKAIDKAGTDAEVKQLQDEAKKEIEKSVPVVEDKPNARKAIDDEATAKKAAIDARDDLTPKAKEDLKAQVDKIAEQAKKSVDAAKTAEAVNGIEESDKAAIKAVGEVNIPADKVLVNDPSALTDAEKAKVLEAVKKVNPDAKEITQDADGNITVTTPDGHQEIITPEQVVKTADTANDPKAGNDVVKPADKVVVNDPAKLTDAEKEKIKAAVEAVNPNSVVTVDEKGNAKVSTPDGQTQVIPVEELVRTVEDTKKPNAGNDIVKPADKTVVANPDALTPEEKKAIEDKVKAVNPGSTVVVDEKGNATVTTPEGKTAVIPATDLTKSAEDAAKPNAGNDIVKPADKTVVANPDALTQEEKKAIEDKVKAVNPGSTVVVDDKGNATVTTPAGKTAVIPSTDLVKSPEDATKPNAGNDIVKPADKTVVANPDKLTDAEKTAIEDKVKAVNPGSTVVVDDKGNATVTTPEGKTAVIPASDLTKSAADAAKPNAGNDIVKPADKTVVANPDALTPEEKKAIEDKVKAVNPGSTVVVDDKGNATVTTPAGKTAVIPSTDLTKSAADAAKPNAGNDIVKPADKTVVTNPDKLTDAEKTAIEDKVKAVNPGSTVVVDDKGNATVTTPEGKTAVIPASDLTKSAADAAKPNAGNDIVKPADKTVVANPDALTPEEKKAIEDKVKAVNPGATVVVDDKGNATVTTPEGKTAVIPATDLTKSAADAAKPNAGNDIVKPADKTVVANPDKLTDAEKKAIEDKVKAVNPGSTVVVDDEGNATVTTPEGKTAVIPASDLTKSAADAAKPNAGNDIVKPADKTVVANPDKLTDAEKKAIEDKVKAVNSGSTVVVDDKGNATVTTPAGKTAVIPASDLTKSAADAAKPNAGDDIVKPADKTVVANPDALTPEEKKAIEDKVKAVNPGSTVVVDDKGNATVTTPAGKTAVIPSTDLTKSAADAAKPNAGNDIVKPADKTVVANPDALTPEEKKAIEDKVKAVNPGSTVVVDDKGNATVTTPAGKTAVIPSTDLTKSAADAAKPNAGNDIVKPADKTVVANPDKLTDAEKKAIEDKVKAVNPGSTVVVDDKGNATVTTPAGKTAVIPSTDLTKSEADAAKPNAGNDIVKPADKTVVANPDALTPEEKKAIEDKVKAVNPGATVVVDDKGNATVTTPEGKTAVIPSTDLTKSSSDAAKPNAGNDIVKPADKTVVANPDALTPEEKKAIEDKVKAVNPGATVVVDDKGNATVTTPAGKTAVIPATDLVKSPEDATKPNAGNDIVKPADKTVVANPDALTPEEKKAIEDKVKAVNPGSTVVVDDKGNATVTTPAGKTAVIPATDLTKSAADEAKPNAGNAVNTPAAKVEVKDPANLTDAEKKAIEDKVKAVNPGSKVVVDDKGNATVTTPADKTAVIPATDLTKSAADAGKANAGNAVNTPASKVEVKDPANLTDTEKKAIEDKVKAVNPGSKVVVDDKGNATVTTPEGKTATIPATDLTKSASDAGKENAGNGANTPATKTVVKDPANLTDEEKAKVKKAVEDVNPGSTVVVNDKGDVIVTKGDGTVLVIPELDLVIPEDKLTDPTQQNGVNTPATRVLVGDKAKLTADEIEKVKESIKAVNPGATVVVDENGNATVTTPEGKTATIPVAQLVKDAKDVAAKNNGENINLDFEKETVADLNNLTDVEKEAAKAKIKGANANVVEVIFDRAGNATVITKDGKVYTIVAKDIFKQRPYVPSNGGGNNGATNTDAKVDKAKLEGAIRQLDELIIKESANLDAETAKEANDLLADAKKVFANADASQAEVDAMVKRIEDFMAKVALSTDHATPATTQAAANTSQTASAQANTRTVAKELPNTGTADSVVSMVAAAASAVLGLGLAGRRRKEDEEA